MNTPSPTPPAEKVGDREATQNSTRRAERLGATNPTVDASLVRLALSDARDRDHLKQLLEAEGIEAEFDRRGHNQNVYGWRLRRRGSQEWLKASTVARDLSWPKIAHRFAESDSANEIQTAPAPAPTRERQDYERAPELTKTILQAQASKPSPTAIEKRLSEVSNRIDDLAPAATSPLMQATYIVMKCLAEAARMAVQLAAAFMRFLQNLLALFGLRTAKPLQYSEQPVTPQLMYSPPDQNQATDANTINEVDEQASAAVQHALDCVTEGRFDDLAEGVEGRDELVAAMKSSGKTGTPAAAEAPGLDALFANQPTAAPAQKADAPPPNTVPKLRKLVFEFAETGVQKDEELKKETPQVALAIENLALAEKKLATAGTEYDDYRAKTTPMLRLALPAKAKVLADKTAAVERAARAVTAARAQHPPTMSIGLMRRRAAIVAAAKQAAAEHQAAMLSAAEELGGKGTEIGKIAIAQANIFANEFKFFETTQVSGHLHIAVKTAEDAPKIIAAAIDAENQKTKVAAQRMIAAQAQAEADERPDDDIPGRK